mgnify:CR=1 FL=1
MNTLGNADTNPAQRQVKVHTADGEWFAWLRTRTPLLGARKDNLIRLRPGGRWLRRIATASVLCALFAGLSGRIAASLVLALVATVLVAVTATTALWSPQSRRHVQDIQLGDLIRLPRRPWLAGIVVAVDTYDGLTYVDLHGDHQLVCEAPREVARVYPEGKLTHQWIYGRVPAQRHQHRAKGA